ncbi:alpha/beta hydrolase [Roseitranquillus sediminis]|uniref:alpha/beta hydrolase n=1 Tax=Roseitranquillus sediminis TaxID=2809051 RepID=UPI001D0C066D|nr:alpha/beta fold hydrolase [Roseitranquillus sediminis]MBM9593059.1 alpha/beta fold hydrolase [Roseitranquillus sediminis]
MTRELTSGRKGPKDATAALVFVHGYGADGRDLLSLAEPLAPHMPGVAFYAPDAPEPCTGNPMGRQWFPIPWLDGSTEAAAEASMTRSVADLNAFIDKVLADEGLAPERLALVGFSQGTMMSLHVAPRRQEPLACVVGFSGRLVGPERLPGEVVSRMPVLLLHGDADEVVPPEHLPEAAKALQEAGFDVSAFVMRGTAHGIAPDGLGVALHFLREKLGLG